MGRYCPCNKITVLSLNWTWVCFTHGKASLLTLGCGEVQCLLGFPGGSEVNASAWNAGGLGSIPGSGRSSGEGNGNPLQYSCLENPMKGGAWWATVHGVAKSQTRLTSLSLSQCLFVGCQTRLLVLKTPEFFDGCQEMNFFFNWSIFGLQHCIVFWCRVKWICYIDGYIHSLDSFPI